MGKRIEVDHKERRFLENVPSYLRQKLRRTFGPSVRPLSTFLSNHFFFHPYYIKFAHKRSTSDMRVYRQRYPAQIEFDYYQGQMMFLLILYIGNKASMAIRYEIN